MKSAGALVAFLFLCAIATPALAGVSVQSDCVFRGDAMVTEFGKVESHLESFEEGTEVVLRSPDGRFLTFLPAAATRAPPGHADGEAQLHMHETMLPDSKFRLLHNGDGTVSLHSPAWGYVSPVNLEAGKPWTARNQRPAGGWEHLRLSATKHHCGSGLISQLTVSVAGVFMNLDAAGAVVTARGTPPFEWAIHLAAVPTLNALGGGLELNSDKWGSVGVDTWNDPQRRFVLRVLRALSQVGAFYLIGHGLPADLFQTLQQMYDHQPYQDDKVDGDDSKYKLNFPIFDNKYGIGDKVRDQANKMGLGNAVYDGVARSYFDGAEAVANGLLHVFSLGHHLATGSGPQYRGMWRDAEAYIGLRALVYHPGPTTPTARTTHRHTDATWVTLLWCDDVPGLGVSTSLGDLSVQSPTAGALLVNVGNVMQAQSGGFFKAVCHWVDRTRDDRTRISMPFFYDRNGSATGGC